MEQRKNQINTNRGKIMKNTLIGVAILTLVSLPTSAGMLGMDWEATGEYNVDTEVSTLKAEVGKTISLGGLSLTADADFDIIGTAFSGTDYKAEMSIPGASGLEVYVKSGLSKTWKREDIIAGVTFSW